MPMQHITFTVIDSINPVGSVSSTGSVMLPEGNIYKVIEIRDDYLKLLLSYGPDRRSKGKIHLKNLENNKEYTILDGNKLTPDDMNFNVFHKGSLKERFGLEERPV